ncbi:hypothetical protein GCM10029978_026390 [Actinoallomurus acanthiterrae]
MSRDQFDLPLTVDRGAGTPLSVQLGGQLRAAMNDGRLKAGERLPSSRALASALGVSRTVVTEAYEQLYAEGWIEGRHGSGTYVADIAPPRAGSLRALRPVPEDRSQGAGAAIDLRPGMPWVDGLDTPAWRRAWRLAATVPPAGRPDPRGLPGLRAALVDYLRRSRGVTCPVDRVLVTRGATNGLDLLGAVVLRPGDRVGVEEPGYTKARSALAMRGAEVVPCPVDESGLIVDAIPDGLRIVYTTPSHQYPLGGRLPVPRRQALLAWARRNGALIAEDDYDSEFRYDVAPLPALYGLDPEVTVYLGTTSKTLAPDVGVGWLVARPDLVEAITDVREHVNDRTAVVPQEAVRILLERGDLDRHVRRMRAEYARGGPPSSTRWATFRFWGTPPGSTSWSRCPRTSPPGSSSARRNAASCSPHWTGGSTDRRRCTASNSGTAVPRSRRSGVAARWCVHWSGRLYPAQRVRPPAEQFVRVDRPGLLTRGDPGPWDSHGCLRAGDLMDVDPAGIRGRPPGHLGRSEVPAAGPGPALADGVVRLRPGQRLAGGPAARHAPAVEPADDPLQALQRTRRERFAGEPDDHDLETRAALSADLAGKQFGRPRGGHHLHDLAGGGVPHEVGAVSFVLQALSHRACGDLMRVVLAGVPDRAGRASLGRSTVMRGVQASGSRQPSVGHYRFPSIGSDPCPDGVPLTRKFVPLIGHLG